MCVLQVGVEGGSLANSATLEEVLTMCLDHVLPLVQSSDADADVAYALFDLFGRLAFIFTADMLRYLLINLE